MTLHPKSFLSAASLLIGGFIGASALVTLAQTTSTWTTPTWTGPSTTPPGGNVSAPINVGSMSQAESGLLGLANFMFNPTGTQSVATGSVMVATDDWGTVGWGSASTGGSGGGVVFINPATLVNIPGNTLVPWTTVSVSGYGVPTNASAVILEVRGSTYNAIGTEIDERAASSSPTHTLLYMGTSQYSTNTAGAQGLYPIANNGGTLSFQYQVPSSSFNQGSASIVLVGYVAGGGGGSGGGTSVSGVTGITGGGNITISSTGPGGTGNVTINTTATQSSGTVGGGCYYNPNYSPYSGNQALVAWGPGVSVGNNPNDPSNPYPCTCPTGYTANQIDLGPAITNRSGATSYPYPTSLCLKN